MGTIAGYFQIRRNYYFLQILILKLHLCWNSEMTSKKLGQTSNTSPPYFEFLTLKLTSLLDVPGKCKTKTKQRRREKNFVVVISELGFPVPGTMSPQVYIELPKNLPSTFPPSCLFPHVLTQRKLAHQRSRTKEYEVKRRSPPAHQEDLMQFRQRRRQAIGCFSLKEKGVQS